MDPVTMISVRYELPDYFEKKLRGISKTTPDHVDLLEAEANRYHFATQAAQNVGNDLKKLLTLAQDSPMDQVIKFPELIKTTHVLTLHSPVLLSAIQYICHANEKPLSKKSASNLGAPSSLPPFFAAKLEFEEKQTKMLTIFQEATRTVEECGFQLAAVIHSYREQPTKRVALQAMQYACYIMDNPKEEKRYITRKGSRLEVLS